MIFILNCLKETTLAGFSYLLVIRYDDPVSH